MRIIAVAAFFLFLVSLGVSAAQTSADGGMGTNPGSGGTGTSPAPPGGAFGAPGTPEGTGSNSGSGGIGTYGVPQTLKGGRTDSFTASSASEAQRICDQVASAALKTGCQAIATDSQWYCLCR